MLKVILRWIRTSFVLIFGLVMIAFVGVAASIPYAMMVRFDPGTHGADGRNLIVRNVDVLTMLDREVLHNKFVVIEDGRIVSISDAPPANVAGYNIVEGQGLTLMPGLIDMHSHIFDRSDLLNYLSSGVTTVRNMMGMPMHLRWRAEVVDGLLPGPRIITAGPTLNGGSFAPFHVFPGDASEARTLVRRYNQCGYDFIKVYEGVSPDVFSAIIEQAAIEGMDVAGHLPRSVDFPSVLAANMASIEHAEEFYSVLMNGDDSEARIDATIELLFATDQAVTPTLIAYANLQRANADPDGFIASVDMARINPVIQFFDHRQTADIIQYGRRDRIARKLGIMTEFTRRLYERGAPVLLGTDTGPAFTVAGASLHDEIALNAEAGVDPYAIIYSGTVAAAAALHRSGEIGVVAPGATAELILVAGNPLEDLNAMRHPRGVVMNGRYYDRASLDILEARGAGATNAYATIGWLLWQQLTRGEICGSS